MNVRKRKAMSPREDMDIPTFAEYVQYVYNLRGQLVRGEVALSSLSFRRLFNLYLLTSLLYYRHDVSFITDEMFDEICRLLLKRKEEASTQIFWHGPLYDEEMLRTGSGFHLHVDNSPIYLQNAARMISESRQAPWQAAGEVQRTRKRIAIDFKPKRKRRTL
jgi:hypothetical protein